MSTIPRQGGGFEAAPRYEMTTDDLLPEKGVGWLTFASVALGLGGLLGLLDGIVAVANSSFDVAGAHYVFSDLKTWGWIIIVVSTVALIAAFVLLTGAQWARWAGIAVAGAQAIAQLLMIQAYPLWSLVVFALDLLVIYALAVHGGRRKPATD